MYKKFMEDFLEVRKVECLSNCEGMLTNYLVTLQNGKKIAVHLMVMDGHILEEIGALPDLIAWAIEEMCTNEFPSACPMVLFAKNDLITPVSIARYALRVKDMQAT